MAQYKQTEFCLDLTQGNTDSLPTWMKGIGDRPEPAPKSLCSEPILFDTSPYASAKNTPPQTKTNRADRYKQTAVSS